jgi:hypothetical protein
VVVRRTSATETVKRASASSAAVDVLPTTDSTFTKPSIFAAAPLASGEPTVNCPEASAGGLQEG